MLSIVFWILFGGAVGLVAVLMQAAKTRLTTVAYMLTGALGGLAGGVCSVMFNAHASVSQATIADGVFAVFGAIIFVAALAGLTTYGRSPH